MAVHLSVLLIFSGLTGIHSITTVRKVSVKAGGSISIPCLYESKFTYHVKYLCKGSDWLTCMYTVKTNEPSSSGKFLISDDKHRRLLTLTIINPSESHYWCAVEINDGPDHRKYFKLLVTTIQPQLFVDHQEVTGFNGDDVTIHCHYSISGQSQWCRLGVSCVKEPSGSIDGTRVNIDANVPKVFTVTMSGLRTESSGWYFCAKGDLQMPVQITVKERPSKTTRWFTTFSPTPEPVNHTSVFECKESTSVPGGNHSAPFHPLSFILPLTLLVFITMVVSFIWLMLRRHKQTKAQPSAVTPAEEEVTYSAVRHMRKPLNKDEANEVVIYSTLAL